MPDNSKLYIVYVVFGIYPCSTGGMEIFYNKLLPEIANSENVMLITNCDKIQNDAFKTIVISSRILSLPGTARFASLLFTAGTLIRMRKHIKLVHLPYTSSSGRWGFVFPLLKKRFRINYLLHIHGGGMKKWKKMNADKALFDHASKILAVSEITQKEYEKRSGRRIEVVLPLVPFTSASENKAENRKKINISPKDCVILFVGSLKELKGPDVILDAFIRLDKAFIAAERLQLLFVGAGPLKGKLEAKAKSAGLENQVRFTGLVPYPKVPQYYKAADIYVIASHFEGTPKSLLEAMFNQLPIIATDVNGINNILTHNENALLFEKNNAEQLRECIEMLALDKRRAATLSKAAWHRYNEMYAFERTKDQLVRIYNENYSA